MAVVAQAAGAEGRSYGYVQGYAVGEIFQCAVGRCLEDIPWADEYARVTYRYEYMILRYCQLMTQKAAAQLLRVSQSTLSKSRNDINQSE
jgi:predicted XRE-type DNA-binding protein